MNKRNSSLDIYNPKVILLSKKYHVSPKCIAYIRAAIGSKRYDKNSLIEHIEIENKQRVEAIEHHKNMVMDERDRSRLIKYTKINIYFRNGVVDFLQDLNDTQLQDVLN